MQFVNQYIIFLYRAKEKYINYWSKTLAPIYQTTLCQIQQGHINTSKLIYEGAHFIPPHKVYKFLPLYYKKLCVSDIFLNNSTTHKMRGRCCGS
jgi:hypothetical protein